MYGEGLMNRRTGKDTLGEQTGGREHPKVRTHHGTRVARTVRCVRCGAEDTLHFIPRHEARALCRKCAAETMAVPDRDAGIFPPEERQEGQGLAPPPPSERRKTSKGVIRVRKKNDAEN